MILALLTVAPVTATEPVPNCVEYALFDIEGPDISYAPIALVMDYDTGAILYSRNADEARVPASLTKLVTIYTALEASRQGRFALDEALPVDPRAYADVMAPGSSLMFLGPGQMVDGWDLLRGLSVSSGNDAAVEVALRVAGSVSAFAAMMNETVRALGFSNLFFEEAAGLSPGNRITAREFAEFTRILVQEWPETLQTLFALPHFAYPEAHHYAGSTLQGGTILQFNRNTLIETYPGADGLKTGYTSAAGYNLVATARRGERRLIAVTLGIAGENHQQGGARRARDASALFDWGFENFRNLRPARPDPGEVPVYGGTMRTVALHVDEPGVLVLPRPALETLRGELEIPDHIWAPHDLSESVGTVRYFAGDCLVAEVSVFPAETIESGNLFRRGWDRIRWWWRQLVRRVASPAAS